MATLIPEISFQDFQKLTEEQIKRLKCCEVMNAEGEYLFTFIRPNTGFIRTTAEDSGMLSNSVGGEFLAEILPAPISETSDTPEVKPVKRTRRKIKHRKKKSGDISVSV